MGLNSYIDRPCWMWPADWSRLPEAEIAHDVRRLDAALAEPVLWTDQLLSARRWSLQVTTDQPAEIEAFLRRLYGPAQGFWTAAPDALEIVSVDSATQVTVSSAGIVADLADGASVHLCRCEGSVPAAAAEVTDATDNGDNTETLTLSADIGLTAAADLRRLLYVRVAGEPEIEWLAESLARFRLTLLELPHEYAAAETGELPVWLYELEDAAASDTWRWTSWPWQVDLSESGGDVYEPAQVSHSQITLSIRPDSTAVELVMDRASAAAQAILAGRTVRVTIRRIWIGGDSVDLVWQGYASGLTISGREAKTKVVAVYASAFSRIPRRPISERCPWQLYSAQCGLVKSGNAAIVTTVDGRTVTVSGAHEFAADELACGLLETANGEAYEITTNTTGAAPTLTLTTPFRGRVDDVVTLFMGCDKTFSRCQELANANNFGGMPRASANLSLPRMPTPKPSGGKK